MLQSELIDDIREQADWCGRLHSPLYQGLLLKIAGDVAASGTYWQFLEAFAGEHRRSLLPLRFLAMFHRQALEGKFPELALAYPSCGGAADPDRAFHVIRRALEDRGSELHAQVPRTVQTNEVSRCCALLPGFLDIAARTGLPLRLLELGCSAGLNLRWDRYRYQTPGGEWGDPESRLVFPNAFNREPSWLGAVAISDRRGCDLNPIDSTGTGRIALLSFVWPDQIERFHQIERAIEIARGVPATLEQADAPEWLEGQLAQKTPGVATVVFHSIVLLYLSSAARAQVESILRNAGERASRESPLAWLSMEPGAVEADVHLTLWPGGKRRQIARAGFHGRTVELL